ncbi:MAG: type III pantothenate kinase [Treponema sp.]|nr:type III pantothenate kinase [Candidatus Treponema equifaecale]
MLLAIDIGNTNVVAALFEEKDDMNSDAKILRQWRISTDSKRTSDEYYSVLMSLFRGEGVNVSEIRFAALASVVPSLTGPFIRVVQTLTGQKPILVSKPTFSNLPVQIPEHTTREIGADLMCNAVQAWCRFGGPSIVVDFGTALTFTVVDQNAKIAGGVIAPGLGTALKALTSNTAQLPEIPLVAPKSSLGQTTVECMQSGIVLGYKGLVEYMIERLKNDLVAQCGCKKEEINVVATGGLNSVLQPIVDCFGHVDKEFTLQGLRKAALYTMYN